MGTTLLRRAYLPLTGRLIGSNCGVRSRTSVDDSLIDLVRASGQQTPLRTPHTASFTC